MTKDAGSPCSGAGGFVDDFSTMIFSDSESMDMIKQPHCGVVALIKVP